MKRREFVTLLGGAAAWPLGARAQQAERMRRVGILMGYAQNDPEGQARLAALLDALKALGWEGGRNLQIELRWASADVAQISRFAKELVAFKPDLIVSNTTSVTTAVHRETVDIPIVFIIVSDPVGEGLVASLSHPGRNITGFINVEDTIGGKWLELLKEDPAIKQTLKETAVASDRELIDPFFQWRYNGRPAGNGWNSPVNNAEWGTDYLNRTATAKSNMYDNRPEETKYIYTDNDAGGKQLTGQNTYAITFAKGQVPPVQGFWSVTLYNDVHLFNPNALKRYSLGTKNKTLKYNADGSLTLYAAAKSPGKDKESNWLPAPNGTFSLYLRAYWADKAILDGSWQPPKIEKIS